MTALDLLPLFRELNDLKRVRVAGRDGSVAERLFLRSWARLVSGEDVRVVALSETAQAVAAARLAGVDAAVLADGGLAPSERLGVLRAGLDAAGPPDPVQRETLRQSLTSDPIPGTGGIPEFARLLATQPRAGATRPGFRRVMLEPAENHADHCGIVAVQAVLSAPLYGADEAQVFLTGLSHHLHNARLPDAGDAGDALLGDRLRPLIETFRAQAIVELPESLRGPVRASLDSVFRSDTPEAKAFQTADVLDRVLEMEWHANSAAFTLSVALDDMDIVHPGPVQVFQLQVISESGLMPSDRNAA